MAQFWLSLPLASPFKRHEKKYNPFHTNLISFAACDGHVILSFVDLAKS